MRKCWPCQLRSTAIASRVMPASGPVNSRSSPSRRLISVDLPVLGRPTMAMRIGCRSGAASACVVVDFRRRLGQRRTQRVVKVGQALAMLGADRDRFAEAERIGFERARLAGAALAFVGDEDRGLARLAHQIGEGAIGRRRAGARIDEKQHGIRLRHRRRGLRLHSPREAFALGIFEAGGIDHLERKIAEPGFALPPVARHARLVVDQRQAAADQPVEQRRFADIRPADNGDSEGHGPSFEERRCISS